MQAHMNKGTKENTGFPLTTGGNDRRGRHPGMTEGDQAGMTGEYLTGMREGAFPSIPDAPLSFPTFLIGNPWVFPRQGDTHRKGQKKKALDSR